MPGETFGGAALLLGGLLCRSDGSPVGAFGGLDGLAVGLLDLTGEAFRRSGAFGARGAFGGRDAFRLAFARLPGGGEDREARARLMSAAMTIATESRAVLHGGPALRRAP